MSWVQWLLALLIIFVCGFLMLVILLQRGRGGGLAGAFGGAGGSGAFGAKTGDVFTWITVVVAAVFFLLCVLGNYAFDMSPRPTAQPGAASTQPVTPETATRTSTGSSSVPIQLVPTGPDGEALPIKITPVEVPVTEAPADQPTLQPVETQPAPDQPVPPDGDESAPRSDRPDENNDVPAQGKTGPGRP